MEEKNEIKEEINEIIFEENRIDEGSIPGSKEIKPLDETKFKEKSNYICKISGSKIGTGFFTKIKYKNKDIPVLITNYHIIDDEYLKNNNKLKFYINDKSKIININRNSIIYLSKVEEYDITIIKLNEDEINHYLEIDKNIFDEDSENNYKKEQIYILHYPDCKKASISEGDGIEQISYYDIKHLCNTEPGSSGGPILSRLTNKIIGIHKGCTNKKNIRYNIGTFLKFPLNDLNGKTNEIKIQIKVDKCNINKDIYFLDNDRKEHLSNDLVYLNKNNTILFINSYKKEFKKYFKPDKEGTYSISIKTDAQIKDCSYMFYRCGNIINIDFSNFDIKNVTDISYMFCGCYSLIYLPDISGLNTVNIYKLTKIFCGCSSLKSLPDISNWNTENIIYMDSLFSGCVSLISLPNISNWNTKNVITMYFMFNDCKSLISLPDISRWNTKNVVLMGGMFSNCTSLKSLPDISRWNTKKLINLAHMFYNCSSLKSLPDISRWNTENVMTFKDMFHNCTSLKSIPDMTKKKASTHPLFSILKSIFMTFYESSNHF